MVAGSVETGVDGNLAPWGVEDGVGCGGGGNKHVGNQQAQQCLCGRISIDHPIRCLCLMQTVRRMTTVRL